MYEKLLLAFVYLVCLDSVFANPLPIEVKENEKIVLIGNGLGERMVYFPYFETELQRRYSDSKLIVRNICHPGDTPAFRPHPSR